MYVDYRVQCRLTWEPRINAILAIKWDLIFFGMPKYYPNNIIQYYKTVSEMWKLERSECLIIFSLHGEWILEIDNNVKILQSFDFNIKFA